MSGVKHTPGPWRFRKTDTTFRVEAERELLVVSTSWHSSIRRSYPLKAEALANARLIAAAPCMFEYILSSAQNGCATAQEIITRATGDRPEKGEKA